MDVSFNGPFKTHYRKVVHRRASVIRTRNFEREDRGELHLIEDVECNRHTFTAIIKETFEGMDDKICVGGFKRAGLYPYDPHKPLELWDQYPGNLKNKKTADLVDQMKEKIQAGIPEVQHEPVYNFKLPSPSKKDPKYCSVIYVYDDGHQEHVNIKKCLQKLVVPHATAEMVSLFLKIIFKVFALQFFIQLKIPLVLQKFAAGTSLCTLHQNILPSQTGSSWDQKNKK